MTDDPSYKKEKVLHTRVSADLETHLKSKAAHLGVSVSNLVRNALLNTADLVETVVADSARIADSAKNLTNPQAEPIQEAAQSIVGWQEVILNLNAICSECNTILRKGEKAAIALPIANPTPHALCLNCLPQTETTEV